MHKNACTGLVTVGYGYGVLIEPPYRTVHPYTLTTRTRIVPVPYTPYPMRPRLALSGRRV